MIKYMMEDRKEIGIQACHASSSSLFSLRHLSSHISKNKLTLALLSFGLATLSRHIVREVGRFHPKNKNMHFHTCSYHFKGTRESKLLIQNHHHWLTCLLCRHSFGMWHHTCRLQQCIDIDLARTCIQIHSMKDFPYWRSQERKKSERKRENKR